MEPCEINAIGIERLLSDYDETISSFRQKTNALNEETQAMNKTQASMLSNILEDKASKRIYVTKLCTQDLPHIIEYLDDISSKNGATKIIVKVPTKYSPF